MWRLALSEFWLSHAECLRVGRPGLSIYILIYLIVTICTHEHYPTQLLLTADTGLQATFPAFFSQFLDLPPPLPPYEQHIFVHDKSSLWFLSLTNLSIHKQRKTKAFWVSATDSCGEKSLPALQLHFAPQQWRHVQTTKEQPWYLYTVGLKQWFCSIRSNFQRCDKSWRSSDAIQNIIYTEGEIFV